MSASDDIITSNVISSYYGNDKPKYYDYYIINYDW